MTDQTIRIDPNSLMAQRHTALGEIILCLKNPYAWFIPAFYDVRLKYRRAFLGPWWLVLGMAITLILMSLLWSLIFNIDWQTYFPHVYIGFILWQWFSASLIAASALFSETYASYLKNQPVTPLFYVLRNSVSLFLLFLHHLPIALLVIVISGVVPNWTTLITMPLGFLLVFINTCFASVTLGIANARYRDIEPLIIAVIGPLMLLTPVLWTKDMLKTNAWIADLNPFTHFIEIVRNDLIGLPFDLTSWAIVLGITVVNGTLAFAIYAAKRRLLIFML